jgi:SAM-dependent methyltransferase
MEQPSSSFGDIGVRTADVVHFRRAEKNEAMLDSIRLRILSGDVQGGMQALIDGLRNVRRGLSQSEWFSLVSETILRHPIAETLLSCPLTRRSNEKPRGYAGDAELLDHIYGLGVAASAPHPATLAGQVYYYTVNSPACRAVRERREILSREIDKAAAQSAPRGARILSIACGHLREAELSEALRGGRISKFIAADQDEQSLAEAARAYGGFGVETEVATVRSIISKKSVYEDMDLVYAAGLFDYLADPIGRRLVERMFGFLRPGGRLLVANFTPSVPDVGYMESFMDWRLIFRTPDEVRGLCDGLDVDRVSGIDVFEDRAGTIAYATAQKRA